MKQSVKIFYLLFLLTHAKCGYGGRCREYHGWRKGPTTGCAWVSELRRKRHYNSVNCNSAKSKVEVLWTCHAIRRIGKRNDVSIWRGKEKTRTTKEKVDGRDT